MRALVTGGAGFIGSHLCDRLLAAGFEILCVDNLLTGARHNVEHLASNPAFEFVEHDITRPFDAPADLVFHLASPASPKGYYRYPLETALTNAVGTSHLLELAHRQSARFLTASTSEVYGEPEVHPQPEGYWGNVNPLGPRACYDEGKRFAEAISMVYCRERGLDVRVVRLFNTYGPRMDPTDGRVVPNFIMQALRGKPLTVYGDGSQTRSLCYVDDIVDGLERVMLAEDQAGEVFNLGNPEERTVLEFAHLIRDLCGAESDIIHAELPVDDPSRRRPDISKARTVLGWEPRVSVEDGLQRTIEWFRDLIAHSPIESLWS
ncbi:MAG TPA: UDP-glucuronic acid decarboxylase family protein [Chloroflexota bacterium]|nr:UDP-glucuronic acid decarboxylase family protein [Chloroflexota bacterium]